MQSAIIQKSREIRGSLCCLFPTDLVFTTGTFADLQRSDLQGNPIYSEAICSVRLAHELSLCIVEYAVLLHVEYAIDDELAQLAIRWGSDVLHAGSCLIWFYR